MPILPGEWDKLIAAMRNFDESRLACAAAERLHKEASVQDVPNLLSLLHDSDAFVREAAAWPLSELAGLSVLRELIVAYQRGIDQGLDNDGFSAALVDLVEMSPSESAAILRDFASEPDAMMRKNAEWLLEFCAPPS